MGILWVLLSFDRLISIKLRTWDRITVPKGCIPEQNRWLIKRKQGQTSYGRQAILWVRMTWSQSTVPALISCQPRYMRAHTHTLTHTHTHTHTHSSGIPADLKTKHFPRCEKPEYTSQKPHSALDSEEPHAWFIYFFYCGKIAIT